MTHTFLTGGFAELFFFSGPGMKLKRPLKYFSIREIYVESHEQFLRKLHEQEPDLQAVSLVEECDVILEFHTLRPLVDAGEALQRVNGKYCFCEYENILKVNIQVHGTHATN